MQLKLSNDDKSAIMSDEVHISRTCNAVNTETERIVKATQVIVNVTKKFDQQESRLQEITSFIK